MSHEQFPGSRPSPAESEPKGKMVSTVALEVGQKSLTHGGERITHIEQQADGTFVVILERTGRLLLDRDDALVIE